MKRDIDLIRHLLIQTEEGRLPEAMKNYTEEQILYHCGLAIEAGILTGQVVHGSQGEIVAATIQKLTWEGHDFLDSARSEKNWKKAKDRIVETGGSWTFAVVKSLLVEIAKHALIQ